jgi:glycosyltransferase involved in cell wall biosynthesis
MDAPAGLAASLALIHDMREEGWPSMDQMGELLTSRLPLVAPGLRVTAVRHPLVRVVSRFAPADSSRAAFLADRVINRMALYPRRLRREVRGRFDLYHVVDHSYAQLVHDLPPGRTIVTCHDVDTFRSLAQPEDEPRGALFRAMTRRILGGLRRAAWVVCGSEAARDDLVRLGLADPSRLRVVRNGIDPALLDAPPPEARRRAAALWPADDGAVDVLHVGNDIPRKRVDRLLHIVAALRETGLRPRLIRVGSPIQPHHRQLAGQLSLTDRIVELPFLDRDVLRAVYERCAVLLLPSDREGFGLPVVEAFAAGRPAVISDIPALREVAAGLATSVVDGAPAAEWVEAIRHALAQEGRDEGARSRDRRAHAASLTWDQHVRGLIPIYASLLGRHS